jgi:hypothetical protein
MLGGWSEGRQRADWDTLCLDVRSDGCLAVVRSCAWERNRAFLSNCGAPWRRRTSEPNDGTKDVRRHVNSRGTFLRMVEA